MAQSIERSPSPDFTEEQFARLLAIGDRLERPEGQLLIAEGETSDHVLLLCKGHVKIEFSGEYRRMLDIRGPGDVIGDMASLLKLPRTADVTTLTPVSALLLGAEDWLDFLEQSLPATIQQLRRAKGQLLWSNRRRTESRYNPERRLAIALTELDAKQVWDRVNGQTVIRLTQDELAGLTGLKRDTIVKVVGQFKAAGIVTVRRRVTTIVDPERLARIARGEQTVTS